MKHDERHTITKGHPLYEWCEGACRARNNLANAGRFRQRNVATGLSKKPEERHQNEIDVLYELETAIPEMNRRSREKVIHDCKKNEEPIPDEIPDKYEMLDEGSTILNYNLLDGMMCVHDNPDYNNEFMGKNLAQRTLRQLDTDMRSFFASIAEYNENPEKFTGRPQFPGYLPKGGMSTAVFSSDGVNVYEIRDKKTDELINYEMSIPKAPCRLHLGKHRPVGKPSEVKIVPYHNVFIIHITSDDGLEIPSLSERIHRVISIDLGVDNFAAIVNNCGLPCLLFKGGVIKSDNQLLNKEMARIQSEQTKGGDKKFVMTDEAHALYVKRGNAVRDFIQKVSARIVAWCVENRIDTVVIGKNTGWKDEVNMGDVNAQNFVQIPYNDFIAAMRDKCARKGVRVIVREESYTSKASFLDADYIPTFGDEKPKGGWKFGGYRAPVTRYYRPGDDGELVEYKVKPRGLYKSRKYGVINSDFNGAANTLRKELPDAFSWDGCCVPDFSSVVVFRHPDEFLIEENRKRQLSEHGGPSKSKLKRDIRKGRVLKSVFIGNPSGIGLCE